jgi:hypothetical protein
VIFPAVDNKPALNVLCALILNNNTTTINSIITINETPAHFMNILKINTLVVCLALAGIAFGDNIIRVSAPIKGSGKISESWIEADSLISPWENSGVVQNCADWAPDVSTRLTGVHFQQKSEHCQQIQIQTTQHREQGTTSKTYRNVGDPVVETRSIVTSSTRDAIGLEEWRAISQLTSPWVNVGDPICTTWTPAEDTQPSGVEFTQTSENCQQAQSSTTQQREQNSATQEIRAIGEATSSGRFISVKGSRTSIGTYESLKLVYTIYSGLISGQYGWTPSVGSLRTSSTSAANYPLKYLTIGTQGVVFKVSGAGSGTNSIYKSGLLEIIDKQNNVVYSSPASDVANKLTTYMGWTPDAGYTAYAKSSLIFRLTLQLKQ